MGPLSQNYVDKGSYDVEHKSVSISSCMSLANCFTNLWNIAVVFYFFVFMHICISNASFCSVDAVEQNVALELGVGLPGSLYNSSNVKYSDYGQTNTAQIIDVSEVEQWSQLCGPRSQPRHHFYTVEVGYIC